MTIERWKDIHGNILDNFEVLEQGSDHIDAEGGVDIEFIEFLGPLGKIRLEFITKPVILDKKTNYSHRGGSDTGVEYIYSETDKTNTLIAHKWSEDLDEWKEMDASSFS